MRKIVIATILVLSFGVSGYSQVTLDYSFNFNRQPVYSVLFSTNGTKLYSLDTNCRNLKIYKTDYSVWKNISLPSITGYKGYNVFYLSDNLFNSDNNVEAIIVYNSVSSTRPFYKSVLIDEFGAILKDFDSSITFMVYNIENNFKLFATSGNGTPMYYNTKVYSLVGSLPCGSCGGVGVPKYNNDNSGEISSPIPNPNNGSATINYSLPNGYNSGVITLFDLSGAIIKTYNVDRNSSELQITTSELASGLYYYNLTSNGVELATKKMVKL